MDEALHLDGVVGWDITTSGVREAMWQKSGDVPIEMKSPGGFITEGVAIMNIIRNYKKGKTYARVSFAASMMTQIAMACDEVGIYDNGIFMIHNAQGGVYGDHNEQRKQADLQERMSNMLAQAYVKKTGLSLEAIKKMMDDNTYLFGQEAVDMGFADYLIETDEAKDKVVAVAMADKMFAKGMRALKEEALDSVALEANLKLCLGIECSLGASPIAITGVKSNNINQGAVMAQEKSLLGTLQAMLGIASAQTEAQTLAELEASLTAANATLSSRAEELNVVNATLATQTEAMAALKVELEAAVAFKAEVNTRLLEAKQTGVSMDVAIAMISAETAEAASALVIASKTSTGATQQGESNVNKEQSEVAYARAYAKSVSIS